MLKRIRVALALMSIVAVTLLFVDFTGTAQRLWAWIAKIQLIPALLSVNVIALAVLLSLTLLFGRVYCSVICPLGILQDVSNWLRGHVGSKKKRKNRFRYAPAWTKTRLAVASVFIVLLIIGLFNGLAASIAGLIAPYSAYGRIASSIFAPIWDAINNWLAAWSESQPDNYTFCRVAYAVSIPVLAVAIITLIVVLAMSWRGGRDYCNTICPVGTALGYLSKYSLLKPVINLDKCINCGKCARNCKAKCINAKEHDIDYTRCVACMDCISTCSEGAIRYTVRKKAVAKDEPAQVKSRRGFMTATGTLVGAMAMDALAKTDGGLTPLKPKKPAERAVRIVPAGALSLSHLSRHCTACQLCIQSCPSHILKPTLALDGFMQPHLDFTEGYCPTHCTKCSDICPVGAFHPVDEAMKSAIKIGTAVVDLDKCIVASDGKRCGSCAKHCPVGAIKMQPRNDGVDHWRPVVNEEACIGCGSCEYHCPVGTVASMQQEGAAIHVEGIEVHREV